MHRVIGKIGLLAAGLVLMVAPAAYASMGLGDFGGGVNGVNFQVSTVNSKAFWLNSASSGGATATGYYRARAYCDYQPTSSGPQVYIEKGARVSAVGQGSCLFGIASGIVIWN